jgi:hypothetical protein
MRRRQSLFPLISIVLLFSAISHAQQWSGVLSSERAVDWSKAGLGVDGYPPGVLPSATWTQCGATIAPYGTSSSPGSTSTINTQIAGCAANTYVLLGSGSFYLSGDIILKNQVVVRGMGANSTLLIFYSMGGCNGLYSQFCLAGSNSSPEAEQNHGTWTAGFAQGATSITMSNSLGITAGSTIINLDQQDEASDTGNIWNCLGSACGSFSGGFARTDNTCSSGVSPNVGYCSQEQSVLVTACSPSCNSSGSTVLTIAPGLYMNNWRSSQSTGAWWATTTAYRMGVEDLSADLTNTTAGTETFVMMNCYECWVSGARSIDAARDHFDLYSCDHCEVQFNYLYQSTSHASVSYGMELVGGSSDNLILGNICQQVTDSCPNNNGGGEGNVAAYNYSTDDVWDGAGWFQPSDYEHASGAAFWLREGVDTLGFSTDLVHGTHNFSTFFRDVARGWASSGCGSAGETTCTGNTTAFNFFGGSRYFNVIGSAGGQSGYDSIYSTLGTNGAAGGGTNQNASVYYIGAANGQVQNASFCANPSCTSYTTTSDPLGINSIMRWGNWDVVTNAVRWCGNSTDPGWSTTCQSVSEVPSSFGDTTGTPSIYANLVPSSTTLPNSFFMSGVTTTTSSSPCGTGLSWWKNPTRGTCEPFPATGPDVSGGDYGQCASGIYAGNPCRVGSTQCGSSISCTQAMGGYANLNPAHSCYLDVMGGPPDGTGNVLPFNRASCYGNDPFGDPTINPPTGLAAVVQ